MTNTSTKFTSTLKPCAGNLKLASKETTTPIKRRGSVSITTENDGHSRHVNIQDVLCVPKLRTNLLSVAKITDRSNTVIFDKKKVEIIDKSGNMILIAKRRNGLYFLQELKDECSENAEIADEDKTKKVTKEWHRKMGHLNINDLVECARKGIVRGMITQKFDKNLTCDICLRSKITRKPLPTSSGVSTPLKIIHSDICGPTRTEKPDIL